MKIIHSRDFHAKLKCEGLGASLVRHHESVVSVEARARKVSLGPASAVESGVLYILTSVVSKLGPGTRP